MRDFSNKRDDSRAKPTIDPRARTPVDVERILLRREEAARAMGISVDHFDRNIRPQVRSLKVGRVSLYSPDDLKEWVRDHVEPAPIDRLTQ